MSRKRRNRSGEQGGDVEGDESGDETGALRRVVCTRPNASTSINGITFATVPIGEGGAPVHISEHVDDVAEYEHLTSIRGYTPWDGDEDEHGDTIETALETARTSSAVAAGTTVNAQQDARSLDEQRANNERLAGKLQDAVEQIHSLEEDKRNLMGQVAVLEAEVKRLKDPPPVA